MTDYRERYVNIPAEMKELRQWVYWGQSKENPKMPFSPLTRKGADASGPATWGSFDEAVRAVIEKGLTESGGIGFEFGEEGGLAGTFRRFYDELQGYDYSIFGEHKDS